MKNATWQTQARQPRVPSTSARRLLEQSVLVRVAIVMALAAVYFLAAKLGLSLAFVAEQVSTVWPPTGIAIAAVLLLGYWVWPGIALGAFLANVTASEPIGTAIGIAVGNTLEAVVAAWLLRAIVGFDRRLERVKDAIGFILLAAGASTIISATIGVASLSLGQVYLPGLQRTIQWSDFWTFWRTWWIGDAMGALVVAPAILTWTRSRGDLLRRPLEAAALFLALIAACWTAFVGGNLAGLGGASLAYIIFPFLIWAAARFGQRETTTVTLLATSVMIWATLHGHGPFGDHPEHERLMLLQVFVGVMAITGLLLGSALAERRAVEAELRASDAELRTALAALKQADRRKDQFLATLAHELRNPMAPMRSGIYYLKMLNSDHGEFNEMVQVLDRQLVQMTRLVDDLLDVSRVSRGKIELQSETIDLSEVLRRALETSRPNILAAGHELTVSMADEPLYVHADPTRLAQVFANLLNNAARYSRAGGRIAVVAAQEQDQAVVRVCDSGEGIDPEMLPHIFDLFVQANTRRSSGSGGLGIGLTLVRDLVQMHGGTVEAHSDGRDRGSEFIVRLPILAANAHRPTAPTAAADDVGVHRQAT